MLRAFSVNNNPTLESIESLFSLLNNRDTLNLFELPVLRAYARLNRYRNLIQSSDVLPCFIYSLQSQSFLPDVNTNAGRTIQRAPHPPSKFLKIFKKILSSSTTFYTDGSKTDAGSYVGLAVYSPTLNLNLQTRISSHASISTAEALAIQLCLEFIEQHNIPSSSIFTDSLSTLQAISNCSDFISSSSSSIFKIKQSLERLTSSNHSVRLFWIPSHCGIPGNEKADFLAKKASSCGSLLNFPLPFSDFYPLCLSITRNAFNNYLAHYRTNTGLLYFDSFRLSSTKPWFYASYSLERAAITTFCRMRSNHYGLAFSLFQKNLIDSPPCPCGIDEDLNHVFWACPRYDIQRATLLRSLAKLKLFPPYSISSFLYSPRNDIATIFLRFLSDCDLHI